MIIKALGLSSEAFKNAIYFLFFLITELFLEPN